MKENRTRKTDRRTIYTKNVIREAFLAELKRKPYDKITVTDLCKIAEINRSTFYLHYVDAISVFDELLAELLENLMSGMDKAVAGSSGIAEVFAHGGIIYDRIKANKRQLFLLQKGFAYPAFVDSFSSSFAEKLLTLVPESPSLTRQDQFAVVKGLMYSYIQLDLHCIKKGTLKDLEHFNLLLNDYLISPCIERLMSEPPSPHG